MDILKKYEEISQVSPYAPQHNTSEEYGFLTNAVIRFSGGRITNDRQANTVMAGVVIVILLFTFFVIVKNFNLLPTERFSAKDAAKQLEEYRKIQPF